MLDIRDTLILFGRSPYINDIKDSISLIINKYPYSCGCNIFCNTYPEVSYTALIDKEVCNKINKDYKGSIICPMNTIELLRDFKIQAYFLDKFSEWIHSPKVEHLGYYNDTPSLIISWAIKLRLKNVVLIGVDYNINNRKHFDDNTELWWNTQEKFDKIKNFLETELTKYVNIYKVNPESKINIPYISIEELLKEN